MTGGGPLPVREFASVAEMRAHYAAVRRRNDEGRAATNAGTALADSRFAAPAEADRYHDVRPADLPDESFSVPTRRQLDGTARFSGNEMLALAAHVTGMTREDLCGRRRTAVIAKARQIGMWLVMRHCGFSLPETGRKFGGKDHTTVLHAVRKVEAVAAHLGISLVGEPEEVAAALWSVKWPRVSYRSLRAAR